MRNMFMRTLTYFFIPGCPYCAQAKQYMHEIFLEHPEYRNIPIREIDETRQPELANFYDYYYTPCFFLEGRKIMEGIPTKTLILAVFEAAYKD